MRFRPVFILGMFTIPVLVACTGLGTAEPAPIRGPGIMAPNQAAVVATAVPQRPVRTPKPVPSRLQSISVPPLPQQFTAPAWDASLSGVLQDVLARQDIRAGVVAYQLNTGRYAAYSPDAVFYAASLYKLTILYEVFKQRDAGQLSLDDVLTLDARHTVHDLDTLVVLGLKTGSQITVEDALWAMITLSDNSCAMLLAELVGSENVDARLDAMGLHQTNIEGGELPTTAVDMMRLLAAISGGYQVTEASRRDMLALLLDQRVEEGIRQGLPKVIPVGHKTGNWEDVTHDAGIVWGPDGPYLLIVLTGASYDWGPIEVISRAVYAALNPRAGVSPRAGG